VAGKDPSTIRFTDDSGGTQLLKTSGSIVATGSRANRLPMVPFDLPGVVGPCWARGKAKWNMVDG
jgi:pyruvate/2-oxoglutarate dehydrogenase complex dihydrolipoamide dehydrogenase (E3) component